MHKHQDNELRAVKVALQQRDARIEALENQIKQEHLEAAAAVTAFQRQIGDLKG